MRFLKHGSQLPWIRGCAWTLLSLAALIALLWAWVDSNGARRWREARAMLAREGQPLDLRVVAPDPVPDADNFCAIPLLKDIALVIDDDLFQKSEPALKRTRLNAATVPSDNIKGRAPRLAGAALGQRADLKQWAAWMRVVHWPLIPADSGDAARDVFEAFTKQDALYKELAVGLDRPHAQWTPSWKTRGLPRNPFNIAFPHLHTANRLNWGLALRCIAAIRAGDAPRAHESAQIITRLTDACLQEPNLTGLLVAAAGANDLADATWELCNAQYGTADDFRRLELALAAMDFRRAAIRAYSGDLIDHVAQIQFLRSAPDLHAEFGNPSTTPIDLIVHCLPSGFLDASAATLADREFVYLVNPIRDHGWQAALASAREFETALQGTKPKT